MKRANAYTANKNYKKAVIEFKIASQNMPKDAEPVYRLGMTFLAAGAARLALEAFQKAVSLNPKHDGARYQVALFEVGSSRPELVEESKKIILDHLTATPDDAEALGALALAEAKLGNRDEAIRRLESAVERNPANLRPASVIIAFYAAKGDTGTARDIARDLAERFPKSPETASLRAEVALALRDTAQADSEIERALTLKRDFRPALQLRLRRELMEGDPQAAEQTTQELSKLPERQMWSAYGRMLFAEKKVDQAMAEFSRVLKEHGDDRQLRDQYAGLLISAGRSKEAAAITDGTLAKDPKDRLALIERITLEIDGKNLDAAAKDIKTMLDMKALSAALSYQESRLFAARGDTAHQGELLTETLKFNPRHFAARLDLVRLLIAAGKAPAAIDLLNQSSPREQTSAEYFFYRDMALISAGNWDEARKSVSAALARGRSPGFLYQDALLRWRNSDVAGARKSLDEALRIAPSDAAVVGLLGDVMDRQGESAQYLSILKEVVARRPDIAALQDALGRRLARSDPDGARAAFEKAKAAGDRMNADCELAALDMQAGALDRAKQRLTELIKAHDDARPRMLLAEIESKQGGPAEVVVRHYLTAVQLQPSNVVAMNNLADTLASRENRFDDALFWARKALALAPTSPIVQDTVGWIYCRQGKFDTALPYRDKSAHSLDRPVAHYHLAVALAQTGDMKRGRQEYNAGVREDPRSGARSLAAPLFEGPPGR